MNKDIDNKIKTRLWVTSIFIIICIFIFTWSGFPQTLPFLGSTYLIKGAFFIAFLLLITSLLILAASTFGKREKKLLELHEWFFKYAFIGFCVVLSFNFVVIISNFLPKYIVKITQDVWSIIILVILSFMVGMLIRYIRDEISK